MADDVVPIELELETSFDELEELELETSDNELEEPGLETSDDELEEPGLVTSDNELEEAELSVSAPSTQAKSNESGSVREKSEQDNSRTLSTPNSAKRKVQSAE